MKLKIKECRALNVQSTPTEEGVTHVLLPAGLLTPLIAEKLRVKEGRYSDEGVPRHYASYPSPSISIDGADVQLGGTDLRAKLIHKFSVSQPKSGGENDISLEVRCRYALRWLRAVIPERGGERDQIEGSGWV